MDLIRIASFEKHQDVTPLSMHLREQNIEHQVVQDAEGQHLLVVENKVDEVVTFIRGLQAGTAPAGYRSGGTWQNMLRAWPVTVIAIVLGILGYLVARYDQGYVWITQLTFTDVRFVAYQALPETFAQTYLERGQWWRLLSPTFLHFGFIHLLFNGLLTWELGRRLESFLGTKRYLVVFLVLAIAANVAQHIEGVGPIFGGLSGVLFGFLGMTAIFYRRFAHPILRLPVGLYVLASASLLAGMFGLIHLIFGVNVADGAHLGGLAAGVVLGLLWPKTARSL